MQDIDETSEISLNALLSRYKDGPYADRENPWERAWVFKLVFNYDIFKPNGFLEKEVVRGEVLDLGCGKGALGIFLKGINPEIKLVGCDILDYSRLGLVLDPYKKIIRQKAASFLQKTQEAKEKFDFIVSCGLPFETIREMLEKTDFEKVLNEGGCVLLLADYSIDEETAKIAQNKEFELKTGNNPIDQSILFFQN